DAVTVVLGAELPDTTNLAQGKLEAMPVVGRRQRGDDEVDLTRSRRGARGRDRGLGLLAFFDERLLNDRALRAVLLERDDPWLRCRGNGTIQPRRRRRRWLDRRRLNRPGLGRRLSGANPGSQIDDVLVDFLFLLVVLGHFYPLAASTYQMMAIARSEERRVGKECRCRVSAEHRTE